MKFKASLILLCSLCCAFAQLGESTNKQSGKDGQPATSDKTDAKNPSGAKKDAEERQQKTGDTEEQAAPKAIPYTPTEKLTVLLIVIAAIQAVIYFFQWLWMFKALKHTEISSNQGLRAYVGIVLNPKNLPDAPLPRGFRLCMINCGQTPAHNVLCKISWWSFEGNNVAWPKDRPYTIFGDEVGSVITLLPNQETPAVGELRPTESGVSIEHFRDRAAKGEVTLYIYGTINYDDVFGGKQTTNFCYRQRTGTFNSLDVCDHHNDST